MCLCMAGLANLIQSIYIINYNKHKIEKLLKDWVTPYSNNEVNLCNVLQMDGFVAQNASFSNLYHPITSQFEFKCSWVSIQA